MGLRNKDAGQGINDFLSCRVIAVVGMSRGGKKFGNLAYRELKARGLDVMAVHPEAKEIGGEPCAPSLAMLPRGADGVVVCVPPLKVAQVLREAAKAGIRRAWLQQGAESPEAVALARELGMSVAYGECVLMYMQPVRSFHAWHRGFMKLFGRLHPPTPGGPTAPA